MTGDLARIEVWYGAGTHRVASSYVSDAIYLAMGFMDLTCEITIPAGVGVHMQNNGMLHQPTVDGTVWGSGNIRKVRDAAGAVVTPVAWNLGSWTWDDDAGGSHWDGADAPTADFQLGTPYSALGGGTFYTGVDLLLGGTYLLQLEVDVT